MKRSILLVLDGDAFRTPVLVRELEDHGWEPVWAASSDLEACAGAIPDLALFDPGSLGPQGLPALRALRGRNPDLALVALGSPGPEGDAQAAPFAPLRVRRMDRSAPAEAWPAQLSSFLGGFAQSAQKFTAEDLFGDILSDLEGSAPAGSAPAGSAGTPGFRPLEPDPDPWFQAELPPADPAVQDPFAFDMAFGAAPVAVAAPAPAAPPESEQLLDEFILEQFGNYNLLEKIAVGGMAELFKARQRGVHDFEKIVAIKRILPHLSDNDEFVRMFIDEAKLAAQLSHPNIVQIYDLGKAAGFYYIAMEYVDGRDLRTLLRRIREFKLPMPEVLAAAVVMRVANALDYAHRKRAIDDQELKLVHRDISPQNILISYEGAVKLVDFGIAKAATKSTHTQAGALKGKLLYMSPEQALGQPLDGRSDIYSLGLVLAELLTGERCFQADSELGVLEKVRLGRVIDVRALSPGISPAMGGILDQLLHRELDRRYPSARLLERDLKALLARHQEPTEHDLAEYVNTLLKGTREELESLLRRFAGPGPVPAGPAPVPVPAAAPEAPADALGPDEAPTLVGLPPAARPRPQAPPPVPAAPARSPWLWPALAALAALAALLALKAWSGFR